MSERQLQFRVGLFSLVAVGLTAVFVFQFGDLGKLWEPHYNLSVHFPKLSGIYPGTPIKTNGIKIGEVTDVQLHEAGGVEVQIAILERYPLRTDAEITISQGLLGDASLDIMPGRGEVLPPGSRLEGRPYADPMEAIERLETQVATALQSFQATSEEWRRVGANVNMLVETNRGNLDIVVERAAESLHQFSVAMTELGRSAQQAGALVGDPKNQENLRQTLAALPVMVEDARQAMAVLKSATAKADENLENLTAITGPFAERSASIVIKLDTTLSNLEGVSRELNDFASVVNREDGPLKQFASDPSLYRNLNQSAETLTVLLANLEPVMRDLRIFSDKIARRPELMGVGGALNGSDGTKPIMPASAVVPAQSSQRSLSPPVSPPPGSTARAPGSSQRR